MSGHNRGEIRAPNLYLVALIVLALDQVSKFLVLDRLAFGASVPVFAGAVNITLVRNPGGAFGILQSWAGILTLATIAMVAAVAVLVHREETLPVSRGLALALLLGGAAGNLTDRLRLGFVVDFIDLRVWPVFNVADAAITAGIAILAYYLAFCERRHTETEKLESKGVSEG